MSDRAWCWFCHRDTLLYVPVHGAALVLRGHQFQGTVCPGSRTPPGDADRVDSA